MANPGDIHYDPPLIDDRREEPATLPVAEGPPDETTCPMCGHAVRVFAADEGTSHYEPIEHEARLVERLTKALLRLMVWGSSQHDQPYDGPTGNWEIGYASGGFLSAQDAAEDIVAALSNQPSTEPAQGGPE